MPVRKALSFPWLWELHDPWYTEAFLCRFTCTWKLKWTTLSKVLWNQVILLLLQLLPSGAGAIQVIEAIPRAVAVSAVYRECWTGGCKRIQHLDLYPIAEELSTWDKLFLCSPGAGSLYTLSVPLHIEVVVYTVRLGSRSQKALSYVSTHTAKYGKKLFRCIPVVRVWSIFSMYVWYVGQNNVVVPNSKNLCAFDMFLGYVASTGETY